MRHLLERLGVRVKSASVVVYVVYASYVISDAWMMPDAVVIGVAGLRGAWIHTKDGKDGECKRGRMYGSGAE